LALNQGGDIYPASPDCSGSVNPWVNRISLEAVGSPVFPYYPCLFLICSPTPVESPQLVIYAGLILP